MEGARIVWDEPHARKRSAERDVPPFLAERIVKKAESVCLGYPNTRTGEQRWQVEGSDEDDCLIRVIVELRRRSGVEYLRVVTVIKI